MSTVVKLAKRDAARALVAYQMRQGSLPEVFERLRSIQFDPLAPVGCNHDLVLQARVRGYRIGDWQKAAYKKRLVYDGWDKQACLISFSGWPVRRIFHEWHRDSFEGFYRDHAHAVDAILRELETRGPLLPRECDFQQRMPDWEDSWYGPSLSKRVLRHLWHVGRVMTTDRRGNNHVYDLTERVVPPAIFAAPPQTEEEAIRGLLKDRHEAIGIIRPNAAFEVWSIQPSILPAARRRQMLKDFAAEGVLVEVDVEGVEAYATPEFLSYLDVPRVAGRVAFLGPLDPFLWDRRMVEHLFGFDYIWEVYKPESQRQWGHYVLPILHGDRFVGRFEPFARKGILEIKKWHWEPGVRISASFWPAFEKGLRRLMEYSGTREIKLADGVDPRVGEVLR